MDSTRFNAKRERGGSASRDRRKKIPFLAALMICALIASALAPCASALTTLLAEVFVYDDADEIPAAIEEDINNRAAALYSMTGVRVVTVCVDETGDKNAFTFAHDLFFDWELGANDAKSVLLIVATGEHTYWTMQSSSLKDELTDDDIRKINDEAIEPDFAAGKLSDSVKKGFDAIAARLEAIYSVDISKWNGETDAQSDSGKEASSDGFSIGKFFKVLLIIVLIAAGIIAALTVFVFLRRPRYVGQADGRRRHYNTDRGAYVGMPEKNDIERARARQARINSDSQGQQSQQGQRRQAQYPQGQRRQSQPTQGRQSQPTQGRQTQSPQQDQTRRTGGGQRHEHPTVYPDRAPYVDRSNAANNRGSGSNGLGNGGFYDDNRTNG